MKKLIILSLSFIVILLSCKKDNDGGGNGNGNGNGGNGGPGQGQINYKGMGSSNEAPEGIPFNLPAGIVVNKIKFTDSCYVENWRNRRGAGRGVQFCITLTNTTNQAIIVRLPPGIVFVSTIIRSQNGILLIPAVVDIAPRKTINFYMEAFCLNRDRKATQDGDELVIGPQSENAELKALSNMLTGKEHLLEINGFENNDEYVKKVLNLTTVQHAVWEITDGSGKLTEEHKQKVAAIQ